jgi:N-acetylneuraminate synthase
MAHAFIDAIAAAGADGVKFQTHLAAAESTPAEPWRVKFSLQDRTRYEYWRRMEFSEEQWAGLRKHAEERGLFFISSPFSIEAVELLRRVGVAAWKVASGEVGSPGLLAAMAGEGLPVLLSTGMSSLAETDAAVAAIKRTGSPLAVLQCTTAYPCPPEEVGLNLIPLFRDRYGCRVGLSDHSGKIYPGLAAAMLGIDVLEVHVTLSREMFGPDVSASVTTSELATLAEGIRFIEQMKSHPVDKDLSAEKVKPLRSMFTKSIVARVDLPAGTVLAEDHLAFRKPGTGLPPSDAWRVLNRTLKRAISANTLITEDVLE